MLINVGLLSASIACLVIAAVSISSVNAQCHFIDPRCVANTTTDGVILVVDLLVLGSDAALFALEKYLGPRMAGETIEEWRSRQCQIKHELPQLTPHGLEARDGEELGTWGAGVVEDIATVMGRI